MFSASNRVPPPDKSSPSNSLHCYDKFRLAFSRFPKSLSPCSVPCKVPSVAESQTHSQPPDIGAMSFRLIYEDSHALYPINDISIPVLPCFSNSKKSIRLAGGEITTDYPFVVGNVLTDFLFSWLCQAVIPLIFFKEHYGQLFIGE
jgi:hypothetical protein